MPCDSVHGCGRARVAGPRRVEQASSWETGSWRGAGCSTRWCEHAQKCGNGACSCARGKWCTAGCTSVHNSCQYDGPDGVFVMMPNLPSSQASPGPCRPPPGTRVDAGQHAPWPVGKPVELSVCCCPRIRPAFRPDIHSFKPRFFVILFSSDIAQHVGPSQNLPRSEDNPTAHRLSPSGV